VTHVIHSLVINHEAAVVNELNLDNFMQVYARHLPICIQEHPNDYTYGIDHVPHVVARMRQAFAKNSYNLDGAAIRRTCRELKIPYTRKGIAKYLRGT